MGETMSPGDATPNDDLELVRGTLDLLILKTLTWGPLHGYAITDSIRQRTEDEILVEEGALYPALHRLAKRGWIEAEWGRSENNRRAKYYRLTTEGRIRLQAREATWERYTAAVGKVLEAEST
jgi:PadR family transcriptional regulator, regulatory protein PadR